MSVRRSSDRDMVLRSPPGSMRENSNSPLPPKSSSKTRRRFSVDHERVIVPRPHDPNKYTIVRQLGRGSFGSCKLVKLSSDNTLHAVKTIRHSTPQEKHIAKKEIDLMVSLRHPFIIPVEDIFYGEGGADKDVNIVMSFCDSGDFGKLIKTSQKILDAADEANGNLNNNGPTFSYNGTDVLKWFGQVCLGMDYLHRNEILHRDIKSANIFLYER